MLGGRDLNPDSQIQSLVYYHCTTPELILYFFKQISYLLL